MTAILTPLTITGDSAYHTQNLIPLQAADASHKDAFDAAMAADLPEVEVHGTTEAGSAQQVNGETAASTMTPEFLEKFKEMIIRKIVDTAIDNYMNPPWDFGEDDENELF